MIEGHDMDIPYSLRNKPSPEILVYEISEQCRDRILSGFTYLSRQRANGFRRILEDVAKRCYLQYGGLRYLPIGPIVTHESTAQRAVDHFKYCPADEALDFIEWCF